jgi:hypothetical protein
VEHITRDESKPTMDRGEDEHENHRPGDERVVVFVRPEHTTQDG